MNVAVHIAQTVEVASLKKSDLDAAIRSLRAMRDQAISRFYDEQLRRSDNWEAAREATAAAFEVSERHVRRVVYETRRVKPGG